MPVSATQVSMKPPLLHWYRNDSGSEGPEDAADLALALGFDSRRDLLRALAREYCFRQQRKA